MVTMHLLPRRLLPVVALSLLNGVLFSGGICLAQEGGAQRDAAGFRPLFNGRDLDGWVCKANGWHVEDGVIAWADKAGFLWSKERFGDFVLDLEFKLGPKTNSGIFVRVGDKAQWLHTGMEIQVLDSYGKETVGRHDCGALYDCLAPSKNMVKQPGEWNHIAVTCKGNTVEVVLNGEAILAANLDLWTEAQKNPDGSKNKFKTAYKDMPRQGFIAFQDHGKPVWFRNIRIKEL